MASRIECPPFTIPAGTLQSAPASLLLFTNRGTVTEIEFRVPPGPSGLVGFAVKHSNEQIIPKIPGQWIITDNETISWPLEGYSDQPDWHIVGYNGDIYDHTIQVRVLINEWQPAAVTAPTPIEPIG